MHEGQAHTVSTASALRPLLKNAVRSLLPQRIRPHRILAGPLRGRRIVTSWHDYPGAILGTTEVALINWLRGNVKLGETWLDIGAHYGYTAIAISELVGPGGRVFAFEPVLKTAGDLCLTRDINRLHQLTVVPFGLDDSTSMRKLSVPTTRGMASTVGSSATPHDTIYIMAFEAIWDMLAGGRRQIDGVKVDVQGMEIAVLRGMHRFLGNSCAKLIVEIHPGVDRSELLSTIAGLGYNSTGVPVDPLPDEQVPRYYDDHSYVFTPSGSTPRRVRETPGS
jgi:FkbM family methyltransferase